MHSKKDEEQVTKIRHSLAHLLAATVKELYPGSLNAIGPSIEDGFYQDFEISEKISDTDLPAIEKAMKKKLAEWKAFSKKEVSIEEAREIFKDNPYKLELAEEFAKEGRTLTVYTSGGFVDLCKGGHVENPSKEISIDSFKLSHLAGAYWRGNEKNKMLTRIYGLAFGTKEELEAHEKQEEEALKRDHRKLGKELDLFTFSDLVGSGLPLFTPKGQAMREAIVEKLQTISKKYGYEKVAIPHIARLELYETSGHAEKFEDEFFYVDGAQSGQKFVMKPMNCPHHTQIFASRPRTYKELPIRYNELTMQYRDEKPGQLLGLSRVRAISIDDAHIFCVPSDIKEEALNIVRIIKEFYSAFDMWKKGETVWVSLSVRDPKTPEKYLGREEDWEKAEQYLKEISDEMELDAVRMEGEAAFYGPKLDFKFKDALGREWQLATAQIDFVQPERFKLEYTDKDGSRQRPVMIHRAIAGSLERFMAVLIEHFAGNFPFWLSPVQIKIIPILEHHNEYAKKIYEALKMDNIRAEIDLSDENLGKKIRRTKTEKIPCWIVIGDKEIETEKITLESRDKESSEKIAVFDIITKLRIEIENKKTI